MRFVCDQCNAKYSIPDERIHGKVLKIKCKRCQHTMIVREHRFGQDEVHKSSGLEHVQHKERLQSAAQQHHDRRAPLLSKGDQGGFSSVRGGMSAPGASFTQPTHEEHSRNPVSWSSLQQHTPPEEREEATVVGRMSVEWLEALRGQKQELPVWFIAPGGVQEGPLTRTQVMERIGYGQLQQHELVWCGGWPDWLALRSVAELVEQAPPPQSNPISAIHSAEQEIDAALSQFDGFSAKRAEDFRQNFEQFSTIHTQTGPSLHEPRTELSLDEVFQLQPPRLIESAQEESFFEVQMPALPVMQQALSKEERAELARWAKEEDDEELLTIDDADILETRASFHSSSALWLALGGGLIGIVALGVVMFLSSPRPQLSLNAGSATPMLLKQRKSKRRLLTKAEREARCQLEGNCAKALHRGSKYRRRRRVARMVARRKTVRAGWIAMKSTSSPKKPKMSAIDRIYEQARMKAYSRLGISSKKSVNRANRSCEKKLSAKACEHLVGEILRQQKRVQRCYNLYLKYIHARGKLTVEVKISPGGEVIDTRYKTNMASGSRIVRCIHRDVKFWRFRPFRGSEGITLQVPFAFSPIQ